MHNLKVIVKKIDILFSVHDAFLEYPSSVILKVKGWESHKIQTFVEARQPKCLNRIDNVGFSQNKIICVDD